MKTSIDSYKAVLVSGLVNFLKSALTEIFKLYRAALCSL